jgi:hypothetical protein
VFAYDPTTGAERWHSDENATVVAARDGRAYARLACESTGCAPGVMYPLTAGANCTGTPKVCTSIASVQNMNGLVLTSAHAVVIRTSGVTFGAGWYANDCTGACTRIANISYNDVPGPVGFAGAGDLVFTAGWPTVGAARIYAIDDTLADCPQGQCQPEWTANATAGVHALAVTSGRLYAAEDDGFVHVYGL